MVLCVTTIITHEESQRIKRLVARVGRQAACRLLRVGADTLENAAECGSMLVGTRDRLMVALATVEAGK